MLEVVTELATLIAAIAALIASSTAAVVAIRAKHESHKVYLSLNGRLDELLAVTKHDAHSAGVAEGRLNNE